MNVENMTQQEMFDIAVAGVLEQDKKSRSSYHLAMYRGDDNTKCTIEFLIDDETAHEWDNYGVLDSVLYELKDEAPAWINDNLQFLRDLQLIHDNPFSEDFFLEEFIDQAKAMAKKYGLNTNVIDQFENKKKEKYKEEDIA